MAGSGSGGSLKHGSCLVILWLVVTAFHAEATALSCGVVLTKLSPCISYIKSSGALPLACCSGVKSINDAASTTPELQLVCNCIKTIVQSVGGNTALVNTIPTKCGVNIPYKYSPSVDCSKLVR
ncbi:Non-specific lipid-transfer protein [Sesamum alatum]|uniref:Non-specific lipid-transfer protein n=1 Tax=Sesamum alatum TaxID=300844 RepID=A0AAE1XVM2_9LAMI|nr:Non-specific lipid-transfer protein [Sesamum alatum]